MKLKKPKYHAELSLDPNIERGTGETFVFHLLDRGVILPATKEWQKRIDAANKVVYSKV